MATINTGDVVRISASFSTPEGVLTNPTSVSLFIRANDSEATYVAGASPIVNSSAGVYYMDYLIPAGSVVKVEYRWVGTGSVTAAEEGMFYAVSRF